VQLYRNWDNIGMQCGGWTVRWQGVEGNEFWPEDIKAKINASSILDALKVLQKTNPFELVYANYTNVNNEIIIDQDRNKFLSDLKTKRSNMNSRNTIVIGAFGEFPYAESVGDINIPYCHTEEQNGCFYNPAANPYAPAAQKKSLTVDISKYDKEVLSTIKAADQKIPVVSVLLSGRPMIIEELLALSDATIAAWLPGTSGGHGIVDAIVGNYALRPKGNSKKNTLSVDWPKSQVKFS
jgi:beta-glucosidase